MKLLLLYSGEDESYFPRFQRLASLVGHKLVCTKTSYENPITLDRACETHEIDAVLCAQSNTLKILLEDLPDFISPGKANRITLDDFAGSIINLRSGREVLVLNPLERLRTVAHEKFVVDRYVSKLTKPAKWQKETEFKWQEVSLDNREQVANRLSQARLIAIDIETPWPQDSIRSIRCVSYTGYFAASKTTESYVLPFDQQWHLDFIKECNANSIPKVFQNGLFDNAYFLRWGCPVNAWFYDTFHLFHSWLSELPKRLDFVSSFSIRKIRFWKNDGKTGNLQDLYRYCAMDGWATINALLGLLAEIPPWALKNYCEHEFPMVFPCLNASMEGLLVDRDRFKETKEEKEKEVEQLLKRIQFLLASPNFNPGSWQQNSKLFTILGCGDLIKQDHLTDRENSRRGTGKIPTMKAKDRHPLNAMILSLVEEYKQTAKQVGTYFDEGKIFEGQALYSINPGGTDTLRAASKESAFDCGWQIQNIPRDDPAFKECCLAPEGWWLAEADKAQSEARCVAYLSGETALINLLESDKEYHSWNASAFFGIPYDQIFDSQTRKVLDKSLRDLAKRTNHGANYNMGAQVMLDTMGPARVASAKITLKLPHYMRLLDVCQYLLDVYSKAYPAVKGRWYQHIIGTITTTSCLVSPLGWTRRFFGDPKEDKQNLNSAVAHAPQNLSVSIINKEWYKIWRETIYGTLIDRVRIKAQIHDSILFIYKEPADAEIVLEMMDTRVEVAGSDKITRSMFIPSDLSVGKEPTRRWSELK